MIGIEPRRRIACLALWLAAAATACVFHGPNSVRRDLARTSDVELESELGLTFGPTTLWIARQAGAFDDEELGELRGLRKVQVGVYRVVGEGRSPKLDALVRRGFTPLVRVREDGEEAAVLARHGGGKLRELLVVVAEADEWTIVRLEGQLDALIEEALELAFDEADEPELHAAVRRELPAQASATSPGL